MELDTIYALAERLEQKLRCSHQMAEYIASILAWEHSVTKPGFELLAEIQAVQSLLSHSSI